MAHGINANVVHRWRATWLMPPGRHLQSARVIEFVPVAMPTPVPVQNCRDIASSRRGSVTHHRVIWPGSAGEAADFAAWDARAAAVIRIGRRVAGRVEPLDMRAGTEAALAPRGQRLRRRATAPRLPVRQPAANRMKVLVHDGIGVWLAARRLQQRQVRLAR